MSLQVTGYINGEQVIAFHPMSYLKEIFDLKESIDGDGLTTSTLSAYLDVPEEVARQMLNGTLDVTVDQKLADKLEVMTGISSQTWLNLQSRYDSLLEQMSE